MLPRFDVGGSEKTLVELANSLINEYRIIICILSEYDTNNPLVMSLDNRIKVVTLRKSDREVYWRFIKLVFRERPDIIHGKLSPSVIVLIFTKILYPHAVYLFTLEHTLSSFTSILDKILYVLAFRVLRIPIIVLSRKSYLSCKSLLGNVKITLLYNGISPISKTKVGSEISCLINNAKFDSNSSVLLSVSRIVPVKNLELQIDAVKKLSELGYNLILLVVGDDPSKSKSEIIRLKMLANDRVIFVGSQPSVAEFFLLSDLFCLSSYTEGLPTVLIEACSAGLPIISTDVGGAREIVDDGLNGFISINHDVNNFADCIEKFLKLSPESKHAMKNYAVQKYSENFTLDIMVHKYSKFYKNIG